MAASDPTNKDIARRVFETPLADTHNHLSPEAQRLAERHDFTLLFDGYASGVLRRCGMPADDITRLGRKDLTPEEKWRLMAPFWPRARVTGVMRAQVHTVRELFGFDDLNEKTVGPVTEMIRATNQPGRVREVLDKANLHHVQICGQGVFPDALEEHGFFTYDLVATTFVTGLAIAELEKRLGRAVDSLDRYLEAVDLCFERCGPRACAIKLQNGYFRTLDFRKTAKADARKAFAALNADRPHGEYQPTARTRPFEDFVYHHIVALARKYDLPVRHHIGFTAGVFHGVHGDHPHHLEPTIKANPDVRFILLHAGYPYLAETIGICQSNANAYADLGWIWQLNPAASARFVREFVTSVGPRQLLLFGGDTGFPETTYGYSRLARHGLAQAVGSMLADHLIDGSDVEYLIDSLCFENARDCFRLADRFGL